MKTLLKEVPRGGVFEYKTKIAGWEKVLRYTLIDHYPDGGCRCVRLADGKIVVIGPEASVNWMFDQLSLPAIPRTD